MIPANAGSFAPNADVARNGGGYCKICAIEAQKTAPTVADLSATQILELAKDAIQQPDFSEDMTVEELRQLAADFGVDVSAAKKKADVLEALHNFFAEETEDGE